ncbi:MAG TPA: hypothetical protein VGN01_03360 [Acidobacteriaceae bacterium]|jgi:hypothetical protein
MQLWFPVSWGYLFGLPNITSGVDMNHKQRREFNAQMFPVKPTPWRDRWFPFFVIGLIVCACASLKFPALLYVAVVGIVALALWFLGWLVVGIVRTILHHLAP